MKRVRQRGTDAEAAVATALSRIGVRFRRNVRDLPGRPDFANKRARRAVFVHGCFWHHHDVCGRGKIPASNSEFWREKLRGNVERDRRKESALREAGFDVLTVWECELADTEALRERLHAFWFAPNESNRADH